MAKVFLLLFITLVPSLVFAQSVVINEIAWMGSLVQNVDPKQWWRYEWLELYNNADAVGMLDGWMLELYRDTLDFRIPLRGAISPRGYFLVGASDKIPNIDLNYKNLAGKFVNSGQSVVLKNSAGEIIDEVDARKRWFAGDNENKRTMERIGAAWQTSANAGGTPKAQNSIGVALKPSFNSEKLGFSSETKKDPKRSLPDKTKASPFFIAFPGALLASALALAARRFLYLLESEPRSRRPEQRRRVG